MTGATILHLITMAVLISAAASQAPPTKYINHTVGDNAGWFFNSTTNTTATNYSSWAGSQTFSLGDYLICKTSSNQTVIQTYNLTTFRNCSIDDSSNNDTFVYNGGNTVFDQALTIIVPLTIQGPSYFFSDASDGFNVSMDWPLRSTLLAALDCLPVSTSRPLLRTGSLQVLTRLIRRSLFRPEKRGREIVGLKKGLACK